MAYVIAVCGSGGKTTFCKQIASEYAKQDKKVCVTTTTHMWYDDDVKSSFIAGADTIHTAISVTPGKIYYIANLNEKKQLITPLNESEYKSICENYDYVVIEADGSRSMPMKIPKDGFEPVIPQNANEIIIVVGMEAMGREIGAVCHRFNEFYGKDVFLKSIDPNTKVTERLIDDFLNHYYYEPIKKRYSEAKVSIYKNTFDISFASISSYDNKNIIKKVAVVLLAAGFSKRFGENKLYVDYKGKKLYQAMIEKLLTSREIILEKFKNNKSYDDLKVDVVVVSQYSDILNDLNYKDKIIPIINDAADRGQSESIKLAVKRFYDYDAIVFVNADLPILPDNEIVNFIYNSILNKNNLASMYTDTAKNPAYFGKEYFDEVLKINGDVGPKDLLDKNIMKLYRYYINEKYLIDIDTVDDYKKIVNLNS